MRAALGSRPTIGSSTTITVRPVDERARDNQLLPHPMAVALDQLVAPRLEIKEGEQLARALLDLGPGLPVEAGHESQELRAAQLLINERPIRDESRASTLAAIGLVATSIPAIRTAPAVGLRMPAIIRSVVVLPAPFGPRNPNNSPCGTVRSMESTAVKVPYRFVRCEQLDHERSRRRLVLRLARSLICRRRLLWPPHAVEDDPNPFERAPMLGFEPGRCLECLQGVRQFVDVVIRVAEVIVRGRLLADRAPWLGGVARLRRASARSTELDPLLRQDSPQRSAGPVLPRAPFRRRPPLAECSVPTSAEPV